MNEPKAPPTREAIAIMEPFVGLSLDRIIVVSNLLEAKQAADELIAAGAIGFDTESKPTFHKGQKSEGPHVLQFATLDKAFIFQSHVVESQPTIIELLKSQVATKIGFGLKGDLKQISDRYNLQPASMVDLDRSFKQLGYPNAVGAKSAIAILFERKFPKSKSVTMSNWSVAKLTDSQLLYAANDAYAAIRVFHALRELESES